MHSAHNDILAYHDKKVTLHESDRREMQERRDTNRQRLKDGLKNEEEPTPSEFRSQGSYVHRTMVQQTNRDYDIDDGVYFWKEDLKGPNGGDKSPLDTKKMVRTALHDDRFNSEPEVRSNCVRVYYEAGYHVDIPVYRKIKTKNDWGEEEVRFEIASTEWKKSDPEGVTNWFNNANQRLSPDTTNGRQLRRQVRLIKAFARSRESWQPRIASGFMISTLIVEECYYAKLDREDEALYYTIVNMRNRLNRNLEIAHPTVKGEFLTSGSTDGRSKFLLEKLDWAINVMQVLFDSDCTREKALKAWDKVFDTSFFISLYDDELENGKSGEDISVLIRGSEQTAGDHPVDKHGGGRFA